LSPFWVTTLLAVLTGFGVAWWRMTLTGVPRLEAAALLAWTILIGLVAAHVVDAVAYHPDLVRRDPGMLLRMDAGLSSFGGIAGGVATAILFEKLRGGDRRRILVVVDAIAFGFPFAWLWGRLGCALVHDHRGIPWGGPLSAVFPDGQRHLDLGLVELLLTVPVAMAFALLVRQRRAPGFFLGSFFVLYAPARFALDFLRVDDARWLGLTPAQWACILAFGTGAWALRHSRAELG
jgi:phosphatidylglycerol:prolipoprotein diacylglycerol transferase